MSAREDWRVFGELLGDETEERRPRIGVRVKLRGNRIGCSAVCGRHHDESGWRSRLLSRGYKENLLQDVSLQTKPFLVGRDIRHY